MSGPSGERLSALSAGGSSRTSYGQTAPQGVLQPTTIPLSHLDHQGRCTSPPASSTSSTEGRASDSTHDSTRASNSSQRPEPDEPPGVSDINIAVVEGLVPSRRPLRTFFKYCLAWMGSNRAVTLTLLLGIGTLYVTVVSYRIARNALVLEEWRDCQDRPVNDCLHVHCLSGNRSLHGR